MRWVCIESMPHVLGGGEHAGIEEADEEEQQEGQTHIEFGRPGVVERDGEIESHAQFAQREEGPATGVLAIGTMAFVPGKAVFGGAEELALMPDQTFENRSGIIDAEAHADRHQQRKVFNLSLPVGVEDPLRSEVESGDGHGGEAEER